MRHPRYIAVAGDRDPFGARREAEARAERCDLGHRLKVEGLTVFCDREIRPLETEAGLGIVIGEAWRKHGGYAPFAPSPREAEAIVTTRGSALAEIAWGDYVAILKPREGGLAILRAPFSDLGCLHASHQGLLLAASDRDLLARCTQEPARPAWDAVANHLFTGGLRQPRTCIAGIDELLWGCRLVSGPDGFRAETYWSPWDHTQNCIHGSADEAAATLRDTAVQTVGARVQGLGHAAVMLSGGLDSSILAACVAASGTRMSCINLTSGDTSGDETFYADLAARTLAAPLYQAEHRLEDVDLACSQASHLARPVGRSFAQATRAAKQRLAAAAGARAILDGGGGDNVFCSLQSAAPVVDRIRCEGLGWGAVRSASDVARFAETGLAAVLAQALRRSLSRSHRFQWPVHPGYLSPGAIERGGPPDHPWLTPPPGALPGTSAHIGLMVVVESLLETADGEIPERSPLMAQPLVEHCLALPSWWWLEGGHNRVVARKAFASDLPAEVIWRRSKGTPGGFVARLFETRRGELRDLLLGGLLAEQGLLDRGAIAAALEGSGPVTGYDHVHLLRLGDVEAWVRSL